MNARPLTDAQIAKALRAHLPEAAAPGLRERVFDAAEATAQVRSFPSVLGALSDADPVGRRRSLLIAAALLLALAVAGATAVGAWRLLERNPVDELSLEPPADVAAFVLSSYERLPELPPVALTWHDNDSTKGRIYVDGSGAVRFDQFLSADATEPSSYRILRPDHRISGVATVDSKAVWIEPGHEAIGDDPRLFLRTVLSGGGDAPGCEMERVQSEDGNATAAAGWRHVGVEHVAGRPTHHVTCGGDDLWLDIETRLILRTREPRTDDAGQPIPGQFTTTEVTEIAFGEQPEALFEPPDGLARISGEEYNAYVCARDLPNELAPGISDCPSTEEPEATPAQEPSPTPMSTAGLGPSDCGIPSPDPERPAGPHAWTPASLERDWPAPLRFEPIGGGSVQPMPRTYFDATGDTGSDVLPCIDIRDLTVDTYDVFFDLVSNRPPDLEPSEAWIAYGVVVDEDRDGVADWRYGIDNLPRTAGDASSNHREWRTNLDTGSTEWAVEKDFALYVATGFNSGYPGYPDREGFTTGRDGARFRFGHVFDTTQGTKTRGVELNMPFYTWASVIVNGRVVATDFAPDAGWLVATPGARPGGTLLLNGDFPFTVSMTLPDGWMGEGGADRTHAYVNRDEQRGVTFMIIDQPATCVDASGASIEVPIGRTVDDLVAFATDQPMTRISVNTAITLDGYRGRYLEYTNAFSDDGRNCDGPVWPLIYEFNQVWILDVDGVRLVIDAFSSPGDPETIKAELRQAVESIHFER